MTTGAVPGTRDPLERVWLACVARLGWRVVFSPDCYASWDGRGTLTVGTRETWDADDSLAQLLLHEICHALVQGPAQRRKPDWGLDNATETSSALEEHACHRLQAAWLDRYGLRAMLAVTTGWRPYWDELPDDPLAPCGDPAVALARAAWSEALRGPWARPVGEALEATARMAEIVAGFVSPDSLWARAAPRHRLGGRLGHAPCGTCFWAEGGPDAGSYCRANAAAGAALGPSVDPEEVGCQRWEPAATSETCLACGACCRQGFDVVGVEEDDSVEARALAVSAPGGGAELRRPEGYCVALARREAPYACRIYAARPVACREFPVGGEACWLARTRVGLSRP